METDLLEYMTNFRKLFGLNPTRSTNKEYYKWKISNNPYSSGYIYLEFNEGIVTGSTSITPKKIAVLGEELLGAEIGDTFTHSEYRRTGICSRVVKKCTEYAISVNANIIYGTPNDQSLPGYQMKLGYPPCPYAKVKRMYKYFHVKPLEKDFKRKFGGKYLSIFLSHVYFYYLSIFSLMKQKNKSYDPLSSEILPVLKFDEEVDGLWGSQRKDFIFFTIRDKNYLNWRFFLNPDDYTILIAKKNNTILGYIVLKISRNDDSCIGSICDFITYQDRNDVFKQLLSEAEKLFQNERVDFIQLLCSSNSPYFEPLCNFGYLIRRDRPVIVYTGTDVGKQIYDTDKKWHFTLADADNI